MKYQAVLFDLDGLLIDSEIECFHLFNKLLNQFNHSISLNDYATNYSGRPDSYNCPALINNYHLPLTVNEVSQFFAYEESKLIQKGIPLKPYAKELLIYLKEKHIPTSLATSSTPGRALSILDFHDITKYFTTLTYVSEVKQGKPYPDIFLKACEKLNINPNEALVLEDSESGVLAAYKAKIDVICIPDLIKPSDTVLKYAKIMTSLEEVKSLFL